ncbi:hypothetical protein ABZ318_03595 [Streptomyces sp. NPDC006197]|uniref:hypothetical protein n=1 Tax=Streptomyces sp. NPDC006197 TaxID=3156685 RepID=UPI0033BEDFA7
MSFHVYPDPQTAALTVASDTTALTSISQLAGTPPMIYSNYTKAMYIRVSMFGGTSPPTLFVKAGTGVPVQAKGQFSPVFRGPASTDYVGDVRLISSVENVYEIYMLFDQDSSEMWQLGIRNNDHANDRDFTWVVADSAAETAQPWIVVMPGELSYHWLDDKPIDQNTQVSNKGTGTLNITAVTPALTAGFAVSSSLPLKIKPSGTELLTVTFTAPAAPSPADGSLTAITDLTASPPDTTAGISDGHNQRLGLTATKQLPDLTPLLATTPGHVSADPADLTTLRRRSWFPPPA